jgi:uncharacterized protein (DUF2236 family)
VGGEVTGGVDALPDGLPLGRDSVLWRVATEPAFLLPSGPRALLLQVAHPAVAAGVADHSDYESRPWVRLIATLDVMTKLAFGTPEGSARQARRLRHRHAEVTGEMADGSPYRALDPDLLLWVWATLVDTLVVSYERYVRPLGEEEREELYAEWKVIGRACGIPARHLPAQWEDFAAYVADVVDHDLEATDVARTVAAQVLRPPLPRPVGPAVGRALAALTAPVLPLALRHGLGLAADDGSPVADRVAAASRRVARIVPDPVRRAPLQVALTVWARPPRLRRPGAAPRPARA